MNFIKDSFGVTERLPLVDLTSCRLNVVQAQYRTNLKLFQCYP